MNLIGLVVLLVVLAAGAGCGGDEPRDRGDGPVTLNVGVIPIVDVAPLYLGMEKRFFAANDLTIKPHPAAGGAAIVPAAQSGDLQIGFSNTVSVILARAQGLPIKIIASAQQVPTPSVDYSAVLVDEQSPIRTAADLEGKTIAVNTLKSVGEITIKAALAEAGVPVESVKFVEVPFPEMEAALKAGRVDAIWAIQQFLQAAKANGARPIVDNFGAVGPYVEGAIYFAMEPYIEEHPDVVERFRAAIDKASEYAETHRSEVRETVRSYTEVPPEMARQLKLPRWSSDLNEDSIQALVDLSAEYGLIDEKPSLDDLIHTP